MVVADMGWNEVPRVVNTLLVLALSDMNND